MKRISAALKNYIVDAVALFVLGLAMVLWSDAAIGTIFKGTGIGLLALGAIKAIGYFLNKKKENRSFSSLLTGIVQIAAGVILFVKSDFFTAFFPTVASVLLAYGAIIMIIHAWKQKDGDQKDFRLCFVLGIIALVLAVIIFAHPAVLANVMVRAAGVCMIVEGVFLLIVLSKQV